MCGVRGGGLEGGAGVAGCVPVVRLGGLRGSSRRVWQRIHGGHAAFWCNGWFNAELARAVG